MHKYFFYTHTIINVCLLVFNVSFESWVWEKCNFNPQCSVHIAELTKQSKSNHVHIQYLLYNMTFKSLFFIISSFSYFRSRSVYCPFSAHVELLANMSLQVATDRLLSLEVPYVPSSFAIRWRSFGQRCSNLLKKSGSVKGPPYTIAWSKKTSATTRQEIIRNGMKGRMCSQAMFMV